MDAAPVVCNDSEKPSLNPPGWIFVVSAWGDVEESRRLTIESGYYERSVPPFLAQGKGKGASSTLMPQARLYVESPFPSASHAGHCKPPKMKTCSLFVILQIPDFIHSRNASLTLTAPVKVRLTFPVLQGLGDSQIPHYSPVFRGYRTHVASL